MKKLVWAALLFALLLQTARCQEAEDLTDDELEELYGKDTPDSNTEAPKTETPTSEEPASPPFKPPSRPSGDVYLAESFTDEKEVWKVWVPSKATKEGADADVAKYDGKRKAVMRYTVIYPSVLTFLCRRMDPGVSHN